ncbi:MAG: YggS family pyridoxal phosphate-dependent enzyme [Paludibacteraceae bacterium]|nr:YggS family pyridoxal phosphate-dependent enzyme [Paludibacteraceae bacterium]
MSEIVNRLNQVRPTVSEGVTLVCVSKFHPAEAIMEAYQAGERDFGESRVQELLTKYEALPKDIRWHMIGHLQTNKVRQIVPFIHLIHSIDSEHLLATVNREAGKIGRVVNVLLEVHVAAEDTKSGFSPEELQALVDKLQNATTPLYPNVKICGIMGMATNTDDETEIRRCFRALKSLSDQLAHTIAKGEQQPANILSMGMSSDYRLAIAEGSTMVRIGTTIFGARVY